MNSEWNWSRENVMKLWKELNSVDKNVFPFDISTLDWEDYYKQYPLGAKQYVLKEKVDEESLKKAWKKNKK